MFDVLVESSKRKNGKRASRYFVVTTAIYAVALLALGVGTIIGFSPALAEEFNLAAMIAPPPLPNNPKPLPDQPKSFTSAKPEVPPDFVAPTKLAKDIPDPTKMNIRPVNPGPYTPYDPTLPFTNDGVGPKIGGESDGERNTPPPPPPPTPEPKKPEAKPAGTTKVSEGVLQGGAIKKQVPVYTAIAKAARAAGLVQVVVTISEEGRVLEAQVINGHPLLRQPAVDAARQWIFSPTTLSKVPVKVQGVLSFNFVLQ